MQYATISLETKIVVVLLLIGWTVVTQQLLASVGYAGLNAFTDAGQPQYFGGYVAEYLLWRMRIPTGALSWGEKIANGAAAAVVLAVLGLAWRWLF